MKTHAIVAVLLASAGLFSLPAEARGPAAAARAKQAVVALAPLSSEEASDLFWMREEEKLARDVYQVLYAQWKQPVFLRIANSEQRHFDALGARLTQYHLADPALPFAGTFSRQELQELYNEMTFKGSQGYVQALTVGATIEEVDIADLLETLEGTTNLALKRTYLSLLEGSKNHLRAFVALLRGQGADYAPTIIDPVFFDAIVGD